MFEVTIGGFSSKEAAKSFLSWYEGGGEQSFADYLDCIGESTSGSCINVQRKGNTGRYYDELEDGFYAEVKND
jgi:hypothetical protein